MNPLAPDVVGSGEKFGERLDLADADDCLRFQFGEDSLQIRVVGEKMN
jgi:hypothetical protein